MRKGKTKGEAKARAGQGGERVGHVRSVSEMLPRVGRQSFRRFGFVEASVVARWPDVVGPELARITNPESIRFPQGKRSGGTLTLAVSGARAPLVQHAEPNILEKVNRFFGYGAVSRVAIRQGCREETLEKPTARPISTGERAHGSEPELKAIADDSLRASLEALAAQIPLTKGPPKIG